MSLDVKRIKQTSSKMISGVTVTYSGEIIITTKEDIKAIESCVSRLEKQLEERNAENAALRVELDNLKKAYSKLESERNALMEKYERFGKNQKRLDEKIAIECFLLLRTNNSMTVKQIHEYLTGHKGYSHTYETTRLYVNALRDGRIRPVVDQQGRIVRIMGNLALK